MKDALFRLVAHERPHDTNGREIDRAGWTSGQSGRHAPINETDCERALTRNDERERKCVALLTAQRR